MSDAYVIFDLSRRAIVAKAKTDKGARRAAEKRNLEYGAHRYAAFRASYFAQSVSDGELDGKQ